MSNGLKLGTYLKTLEGQSRVTLALANFSEEFSNRDVSSEKASSNISPLACYHNAKSCYLAKTSLLVKVKVHGLFSANRVRLLPTHLRGPLDSVVLFDL